MHDDDVSREANGKRARGSERAGISREANGKHAIGSTVGVFFAVVLRILVILLVGVILLLLSVGSTVVVLWALLEAVL